MTTSIIDDQDLSNVQYTGNWNRGGTSHEHAGTVSDSTVVGDFFTVTFNGTDISVHGTIDSTSRGVVTSYSIDGAPASQVTSTAGSGDTYNQLFWQSPTLTANEHKLVVKMVNVNADAGAGEGTIWFDYFQVTDIAQTSPSSAASAVATTPTPIQPTQAVAHRAKKVTHLGPIVGGIVAVIVCLGIVAFLLLFFLRRRRTQRGPIGPEKSKQEIDPNSRYRVTPYSQPLLNTYPSREPLVHTPGIGGANSHGPAPFVPPSTAPSNYSLPLGQPVMFYQNQAQNPSLSAINPHPLVSTAAAAASSYAASTVPSQPTNYNSDSKRPNPTLTLAWMPEPEPIQHVDSGVRVVDAQGVKPVEFPPVYSAK